MPLHVVRADERPVTTTEWLTSRHGFSFGDHYDPANTHHGALLVHNDETVAPGQGFDTHPHAETEIVTWVLSGSLVHQDSQGHSGIIHPGLAQRMSAGTGILHSERNDHGGFGPGDGHEPVHYIQMWLQPDAFGVDPSYEQCDVSGELAAGGLIPLASGVSGLDSAVRLGNSTATLWVARLRAGESVVVPAARFSHLYLAAGSAVVESTALGVGDTLRADDLGGSVVAATSDTEFLLWSMDTGLGGF